MPLLELVLRGYSKKCLKLMTGKANEVQICLHRYERQIKELKAELTMRDSLAGRGQVNYNDLSDTEVADLKAQVSDFLEGSTSVDALPCQTLKQVRETYRQMQLAYTASRSSQVTPVLYIDHMNASDDSGTLRCQVKLFGKVLRIACSTTETVVAQTLDIHRD